MRPAWNITRRHAAKIKSDVNHNRCEVQIAIAIADGTEIDMTPVTITITPGILYELAGDVIDVTPAQWLEKYSHRLTLMPLEHSRDEVKYIECHRPDLMLVDSDGQCRPMI